jgi:hypothetical protein
VQSRLETAGVTTGRGPVEAGPANSAADERAPQTPIQLAGTSKNLISGTTRWIRQGATWLHAALAVAVVLAVFVQVYLIGAYLFGAGAGALNAHKSVGFIAHSIELAIPIMALVAWLPRTEIILSIALAVVGTVQVALADAHRWVGALHPLAALAVLIMAALVAWRSPGRHRSSPAHRSEPIVTDRR